MTRFQAIALACVLGVMGGVGAYTFHYAEGLSYFSPDARACTNCHIMNASFDSWQKASHHTSASCVDCHLPHALLPKLVAKTDNGYRHSKGFTFQNFHEPIFISSRGSAVLQDNCLRCHEALVHGLPSGSKDADAVRCVHCHASVGHGERLGLGRIERFPHSQEKGP